MSENPAHGQGPDATGRPVKYGRIVVLMSASQQNTVKTFGETATMLNQKIDVRQAQDISTMAGFNLEKPMSTSKGLKVESSQLWSLLTDMNTRRCWASNLPLPNVEFMIFRNCRLATIGRVQTAASMRGSLQASIWLQLPYMACEPPEIAFL